MRDLKYLGALSIPLSVVIGLYIKGFWTFLTPIYAFAIVPVLEIILPLDNRNFSEEEVDSRKLNKLFDWMLYLNIPILYGILYYAITIVSYEALASYEFVGVILSVGIMLGSNGINVGHEIGHRQASNERFLGKLLLIPALYMHFYIEHNFGHHKHAATKEDPATASYGQHVYSFWFTSVTRQYISAWKIQLSLLTKYRKGFFSFKNDMLWSLIIQGGYLFAIYLGFGSLPLIFALCAAVTGFLLLETVNYIEHYGLLRMKSHAGKYERVKEVHSWNSDHVVGRIILYELTRHSDHHYKASKKYQVLETHDESPRLPFGYPTSMVLALIPPLWFSIMNKRVPKEMIPTA
jgi:alkane 1-monooxygenase